MVTSIKTIEFYRTGLRLSGTLTTPDTPTDRAVIMVHGGPNGNQQGPGDIFVKMAAALAENGIASLRFDCAGSGESDGDFIDTTVRGEADDLRAAQSYMLSHGYSRLGLIGESLGGTVAVLGLNHHYRALALWWPAITLRDTDLAGFLTETYAERLTQDGFITVGSLRIGPDFLDEVRTLSVLSLFPAIVQPTLFLHGDADQEVPHEQSVQASSLVQGPVRLEIFPGGGHGLRTIDEQERVSAITLDWFLAYLQ